MPDGAKGGLKHSIKSLVFWNQILGFVVSILAVFNLIFMINQRNDDKDSSGDYLITVDDYARLHKISPMDVQAAIAENRLKPPAFPIPYEDRPQTFGDGSLRWLVKMGAVIEKRTVVIKK